MAERSIEHSADRLYTPAEAAKLLGVSISTLKNWERSGYLTESKMAGARRRYTKENLRHLLQVKVLTERHGSQERVLAALSAGEKVDPPLPWETVEVGKLAREQPADLDSALDLAAQYAALFAGQRRLVNRLRIVEQQYLVLTGVITEMVVVVDRNGLVFSANPATGNYGCEPDKMVGRPLARYLAAGSAREFKATLSRMCANQSGAEELAVEWMVEKKRSLTVHLTMRPIGKGDGLLVLCMAHKQYPPGLDIDFPISH
ncbi:MAG: MerR family transcriptional regulator [Chloroflexi bacterium]|nr:MerR family transcriptional regulator [Chloroflexota bacterium]